jgi:hypothetical protein
VSDSVTRRAEIRSSTETLIKTINRMLEGEEDRLDAPAPPAKPEQNGFDEEEILLLLGPREKLGTVAVLVAQWEQEIDDLPLDSQTA